MSRRVVLVLLTAIVLSLTATCVTRGLRGIFEREAPVVSLPGGSGGVNRPEHREKPYVVLVSFDGFRHDYIDLHETPSFHRIIRNGVRAEGLIPVFPSLTFPNHLSIVTGMYPDRHGIVANRFYDPQRDATYVYSDSTKTRDSEWYQGEPIWVTAEKQGMVTATYFWPGSNAVIDGVRPTYWKPYNGSVPNRKRVDQVLEWLQLSPEKRPHFITLYFSDVDNAGHEYGPGMPETRTAIQEVDRALGHLLDGIAHLPMAEQVYVVLVSDHGMTEIRPETYAALEDVADLTGVRAVFNAAVANLYVQGAERARALRDGINARLEHGQAYLRAEIPHHLHYSDNPRAGDVVVVMDGNYVIGPRRNQPLDAGGMHGYDPALPSMRGIFLVAGPGIAEGKTIPAFENIHIYPFMTDLLGVELHNEIDGKPGFLYGQVQE